MTSLLSRNLLRQSRTLSLFNAQSLVFTSTRRKLQFNASSRKMADKPTQAGQVISEVAQAEGGPYKGSNAAQMQSQVTKGRNFEQAAAEVGAKMQVEPENVTSEVRALVLLELQKSSC